MFYRVLSYLIEKLKKRIFLRQPVASYIHKLCILYVTTLNYQLLSRMSTLYRHPIARWVVIWVANILQYPNQQTHNMDVCG